MLIHIATRSWAIDSSLENSFSFGLVAIYLVIHNYTSIKIFNNIASYLIIIMIVLKFVIVHECHCFDHNNSWLLPSPALSYKTKLTICLSKHLTAIATVDYKPVAIQLLANYQVFYSFVLVM